MTWGFFEMTFFATSGFLNRQTATPGPKIGNVYQGENTLNKLVLEIQKVVQKIEAPFEIIIVETQYIEEALKKRQYLFMTMNWYNYSGNIIQLFLFFLKQDFTNINL